MNPVGMPELVVILVLSFLWVIPIVVAIWALVTLQRIRSGQDAVQAKLESIERLLQRS